MFVFVRLQITLYGPINSLHSISDILCIFLFIVWLIPEQFTPSGHLHWDRTSSKHSIRRAKWSVKYSVAVKDASQILWANIYLKMEKKKVVLKYM